MSLDQDIQAIYFLRKTWILKTNDVGLDHQSEIKVVAKDKNDQNAVTERLVVINVDNVYEAPVITEPNAGDAIQLQFLSTRLLSSMLIPLMMRNWI